MACGKSELQYGEPRLYQADIVDDYVQFLTPKNSLTPGNPIYFDIEGTPDFLDLSQTQLKIKLNMTKADGTGIPETMKVCPINNVLHSLFSQVQISMKDTIISHSNSMYPYRAYIENLLNFSRQSKDTWMYSMGWADDSAGEFDADSNEGIENRRKSIINKRTAEYKGRLHLDIGFQEKLLPSNLDVRITLSPAKQDFFCLNFEATGEVKVNIVDAVLCVRKVKVAPTKQLALEKEIAKNPIVIPISYVTMKNISIPSGVSSFNQDGVFTGPLPTLVVLGLVDNRAFVGQKDLNPFNFKNYGVNSIGLRVNGKNIPTRPLQPDYTNHHSIDCYQTLFQAMNRQFDNFDNGIGLPEYEMGNTLYAFNLTPDQCLTGHPLQSGSVDISIRFAAELEQTASLIIYSQYENNVYIDQHRNCVSDIHG